MRKGDEPCIACQGGAIPCKGGGNLQCWRRDSRRHRIALILDTWGGARTIVAPIKSLRANVRHDEIAHIVPGLFVHTPIAWNDIPIVIERARIEFEKWLDTKPNLEPEFDHAVKLYFLHQKRHPSTIRSLNPETVVLT
jgi:hypothetical protein